MTRMLVVAFDIWRNAEQLCSAAQLYYYDYYYVMLLTYAYRTVCKAFVAFLFVLSKVLKQYSKWLKNKSSQIEVASHLWMHFPVNTSNHLPDIWFVLKSVTSGKEKQTTTKRSAQYRILAETEIAHIALYCLFDSFSGAHALSGCTWSKTTVWLCCCTRADSDALTLRVSFHPNIQGHVLLFLEVKEREL